MKTNCLYCNMVITPLFENVHFCNSVCQRNFRSREKAKGQRFKKDRNYFELKVNLFDGSMFVGRGEYIELDNTD